MGEASARRKPNEQPALLDTELEHLPPELRWREWMGRVEAVIFAASEPVTRSVLARVVGRNCNIDLIVDDIRAELAGRPYSPQPGAPYTYVTTKNFLSQFGLDTLRQLPDFEALEDAGLLSKEKLVAGGIPAGLANADGEGDVVEDQVS
ncbi:hypothetical protein O7A70_05115 [Mesorhizobium sp. Cs1299R1N1]|uniref:hypothetical protein n=1 Tax=Mesorhizobium sp. Cs1299R1N1 TaxID=3015172 RepID=UPI00301CCE64